MRKLKKILPRAAALLLTLAVVIYAAPLAFAAGGVISGASELASALASGGSFSLGGDMTLDSPITVSSGVTELDLAGHRLSYTGGGAALTVSGGNLTILDSAGGGALESAGDCVYVLSGSLNLQSAHLTASGSDSIAVLVSGGSALVSGGELSGRFAGICDLTGKAGSVCVMSGSFVATGGSSGGVCVWEGASGTLRPDDILNGGLAFSSRASFAYRLGNLTLWAGDSAVTAVPSALFISETKTYSPGAFGDVDESAWYGAEKQAVVADVCELGLMQGTDGGVFKPEASLLVSEAVCMAAILRDRLLGGGGDADFQRVGAWYQVYYDYLISQGIISEGDFNDLNRAITRAEMAYVFASAGASVLYGLNTVVSLPDVSSDTPYSQYIMELFRSGVLTGSDGNGTYRPADSVQRAEAAAIISRIALPDTRAAHCAYGFASQSPLTDAWNAYYSENMYIPDSASMAKFCNMASGVLSENVKIQVTQGYFNSASFRDDLSSGFFDCSFTYYYTGIGNRRLSIEFKEFDYSLYTQVLALTSDPSLFQTSGAQARMYYARTALLYASIGADGISQAEACRAFHDRLILTCDYSSVVPADSKDPAYSFTGLLDSGSGVCQAYMELFDLLARIRGIDSHIVIGTGSYDSHGWNMVVLRNEQYGGKVYDGEYHIDVTWDDQGYAQDSRGISTAYFLITKEQLLKDHTIQTVI